MGKVLITEGYLENIAGSIRRKLNTGETYKVSEMSPAIDSIPTAETTTKTFTSNGTYNAETTDGVDGYSQVTVDVPQDELAPKTITANGTYNPASDGLDGYSSVLVNVSNGVTAADNGKVVVNGFLTPQTSRDVTENGVYDTTTNNNVRVNVPNTYSASDEGKVVSEGALVSQTSKSINANGTYETTTNNSVAVSVPNSYALSDEGKVVSEGTLVSQTGLSITEDGTYDTTTNNSVTVSVEESGLAAILGNFATVEATTTASKAYAVGDYLVYDEKFYVVTAPIAQGGTITPGTNCTQTNVGNEVTALNNSLTESQTPTATTYNSAYINSSLVQTIEFGKIVIVSGRFTVSTAKPSGQSNWLFTVPAPSGSVVSVCDNNTNSLIINARGKLTSNAAVDANAYNIFVAYIKA